MKKTVESYRKNILALASRKADFDQIVFDVSSFCDKIGYQTIAKKDSGIDEKRETIIKNEIQNITNEELKNYLSGLIAKKDLWIFEPGNFKVLVEEINSLVGKTIFLSLTTAIDLKDRDLKDISKKLSKKMERNVIVDLIVDKSVLGGAVIKKDNYIFDFSLKTKLSKLSSEWKKAIHKVEHNG